jgi:hypothetical protein
MNHNRTHPNPMVSTLQAVVDAGRDHLVPLDLALRAKRALQWHHWNPCDGPRPDVCGHTLFEACDLCVPELEAIPAT